MKFEKLERRCVFDAGFETAFCSAFDFAEPQPSTAAQTFETQTIETQAAFYGPIAPQTTLQLEAEADIEVGLLDVVEPLVDYSGPVVEVGSLNVPPILVSQQSAPEASGIRGALEVLESAPEFTSEWLAAGIKAVYHANDSYYFEFQTPLDELMKLGHRTLFVDLSDGAIRTSLRF